MRCVQQDHHIQAWVRDRVKVLELLAELRRLQELREKRDAPHVEVWTGTQYKPDAEGMLVAVRTDEVRAQ